MNGLIWASAVSVAFFVFTTRFRRRSPVVNDWFGREQFALLLALLGTFSIATGSSTEEVLRDPVRIERVVRGGLAVAALLVATPILLGHLRSYKPGRRATLGLLTYLGVALASTLYSAAPLVTAGKVLELTAGLAAVLAIALGPRAHARLRNTVTLIVALVATMLAIAAVGFLLLPSTFRTVGERPGFLLQETLASPYFHSNGISALGALIAVFALATILTDGRNRWLWSTVAVVGVANIVLASGRQGVVILLLGVAVVLWAARPGLLIGFAVPASAWIVFEYGENLFDIFARNRPQNLASLSGRVDWWAVAIETWSVHPWTGWGYGAGGRFVALASIGRTTNSVHSGYVESLVGVGIIGVAGLLYALGQVVLWSIRNLRVETALATLIVPLALRTGVSQGFGGWLNIEFVLFALLVSIADQARIDRREAARADGNARNPLVVLER